MLIPSQLLEEDGPWLASSDPATAGEGTLPKNLGRVSKLLRGTRAQSPHRRECGGDQERK